MPANRKCEWIAVNEMKSVLFSGTNNDLAVDHAPAKTFATMMLVPRQFVGKTGEHKSRPVPLISACPSLIYDQRPVR
jgi:hypothetical protein